MPQIRQNIATKEWVIIATERAKRPEDFIKEKKEKKPIAEYIENCPFCPGNEEKFSPVETFSIKDGKNWKVRVIPNKFPALVPAGDKNYRFEGIKRTMNGIGIHEVIIENPKHNVTTALLPDEDVVDILNCYKQRYLSALSDDRIELVTIFKNHGESTGASQVHPHSQMVASPMVPAHIRNRIEEAMRYHDDNMECVFCMMIREELKEKERIILQTDHFVGFIPFAALSPFHIWILPRRHMSCFPIITDEETNDLAFLMKNILARIYHGLDNADYNYVIRSLPGKCRDNDFFHWYISIIPKVTKTAGFELGSGMYINVALPEESAKFLREIKI